jgi:predicted RNA-binding Zn-ribbon protein involved in translation (DUF1610 family)
VGWFGESSAWTYSQPACCMRCGRDLSPLQMGAKFCPDCGCKIPAAKHRRISLVRQILPLIHFGGGNVPGNTTGAGRTAILIGYANALYHLGWRYEGGSGTPKNLSEATRCYKKSARLGNIDAVMRLTRIIHERFGVHRPGRLKALRWAFGLICANRPLPPKVNRVLLGQAEEVNSRLCWAMVW